LGAALLVVTTARSAEEGCNQHLYGSVVDASFFPVSGVRLGAFYPDGLSIETTSTNWGNFGLCLPVGPGQLRLAGASAEEYLTSVSPELNMRPSDSFGIMFPVLRVPRRITGVVRSTTGQPFTNALVAGSFVGTNANFYSQTRTDSEGRYSLRVGDGNWAVYADCADFDLSKYFCQHSQRVTVRGTNVTHEIVIWPTVPANPPTLSNPVVTMLGGQRTLRFTYLAEPGKYELFESDSAAPPVWRSSEFRFNVSQPNQPDVLYRPLEGPARFFRLQVRAD
jgi:hypothetical protein